MKVGVPVSSIDFDKLVNADNQSDILYDVSLDVELLEADFKSKSRKITYDVSPVITFTTTGYDAVLGKAELNDYLTENAQIQVTLPTNGLDVKEIVHRDGDNVEYIYDMLYNETSQTVSFTVSHFSSFTLNETPENPDYGKTTTENEQETGRKPAVDTATENSVNYAGMIAGFITSASLISYCVLKRKVKFID